MIMAASSYLLGHDEHELERLIDQARFYGDLTERLLVQAGLRPGMRVLDTGCGAGDVSFLAARIVGNDGMVIGIDKAPDAIETARDRAKLTGLTNIHFIESDLGDLELDAPVDAIVGRLILMHVDDPVATLRTLTRMLTPGGLMVFQEMDTGSALVEPPVPEVIIAIRRIVTTFQRAGIDSRPGLHLPRIFNDAGLAIEGTHCEARLEPSPCTQSIAMLTSITRTLMPLMEKTGVATPAEVEIDSLEERLKLAVVAEGAVMVPPPLIGVWARTPHR